MAIMGQQIGQQLLDALNLPKQTVSFVLRCSVGQLVTVECEYLPNDRDGIVQALSEFYLVPKEPKAAPALTNFDSWMRERVSAAHKAYMMRHAAGGVRYAR